ncbi:hypothetical protein BH10PSE12_BH10PSE12_14320 [soil metagenome]
MSGRRFALAIAALTVLCIAFMMIIDWRRIVEMNFRDSDDALRYVEVHAFLNGQAWTDVSQHRVNPPFGGPMHWSRLVDLPIAALMAIFQPLVGMPLSDRIAMTAVPMGLTAAMFAALALATRRLAGEAVAIIAAALLAVSLSILIQFHPLRIDHHNWQILMSAVTLWAVFDPRLRRGGVIAGASVALWVHISAEALPYAAMFGGLFALHFLRKAEEWPRFLAYVATLTGVSILLLVGVRGWTAASIFWCDSLSPAYLLPMSAVALSLPLAYHVLGSKDPASRFGVLAIPAILGGIVFLFTGKACLGGPFEALDPVVYNQWYLHVSEGRPIWEQSGLIKGISVAPILLGLFGGLIAIVQAPDLRTRLAWINMTLLAIGAAMVAMNVMRAMSVAHLFVLPGNAWLLLLLGKRAQALRSAPARIVTTVALVVLTPIGVEAVVLLVAGADKPAKPSLPCTTQAALQGLAALPPGTIFAPIDASSFIVAFTPHSVIATGHHRNSHAMAKVILGFSQNAAQARPIVQGTKVKYLAYCPAATDFDRYAKQRPDALANDLDHNRVPDWLRPIPMPAGQPVRVYRVVYPPATKRIATPFMQ